MGDKILVVDDEQIMRESLTDLLSANDSYDVMAAQNGEEALELLQKHSVEVLLADLKMDEVSGLDLLKWVQQNTPLTETIVLTAHGSVDNAVEAMKHGAFNYLTKPFQPETVEAEIESALEHHRLRARNRVLETQVTQSRPDQIVGDSEPMREVFNKIESLQNTDVSVLIRGETGTGKELVARAIHEKSERSDGNFAVVDCGTLPEELIESELFGHKKGAFTDAHESKPGKFELADGGTLFLDEIGNLPTQMQAKLLRFLQEHKFVPVGGTKPRQVDTRILAATNVNLEERLENGSFREDLYYRLNVMTIQLPPLRKRTEDIPRLASHFVRRYAPELNPEVEEINEEALAELEEYHWPGNVRELENCIKHALTVTKDSQITPEALPENITGHSQTHNRADKGSGKSLEQVESEHIQRVIENKDGNLSAAARVLDINRSTLYNKIKKYGLETNPD